MSPNRLVALFALSLAAGGCAAESDEASAIADSDLSAKTAIVITASTVQALDGSLEGVSPAVRTADRGRAPESYLATSSALGPAGPLGAWGPLGALGPIGDASWNTSSWMSAAGDWRSWSEEMTKLDGPLSESGPLGPQGPLGKEAYTRTLPSINDWSKQLQAGGVFSALGPVGPLGALGPLGPLGPLGAHGFASDAQGNYRNGTVVVRTVDVPYEGSKRTYELVEKYTEAHAKTLADNDTSFMVIGSIDNPGPEVDGYRFTSREEQFVTVVVVPENGLSDFDVELLDATGKRVARSDSDGKQGVGVFGVSNQGHYVDFVQLKVARGEKLEARVSAKTVSRAFPTYRLVVVGATKALATTDIKGPHQIAR